MHELGLSEVARITKGFEQIQQEVGFKGTLKEFFDYMRTSPKFQPKSKEELEQGFATVKRKVEAKVPQFFSRTPKAGLVIRPYPPYREKFEAGGSYEQGTPDGSRPGTFYFNAYDLPSRSTWEETTLFMHEGEPGHHFQISLAQENPNLPAFMRFGGNTAYVEGWALYSESLGYPMAMYTDPYQRFGNLNDEMLRAMRLVVDTGIHSKGWTRDQSIQYMLDHSGELKTDATAEVERYIAIPSQALAYKIGQLEDQRASRQVEGRARSEIRHPRISRAGARHRSAAAADPREEDRQLDRVEAGGNGRRPGTDRQARRARLVGEIDERRELDLALDEAGLVAAHRRIGDKAPCRRRR